MNESRSDPEALRTRLTRRFLRRLRGAPTRGSSPLEYVLVVTYGRSGSTLVQGLLNSLPGVLVRGENSLYVLLLYRAMARALAFREVHRHHSPHQARSAFYGLRGVRRRHFVDSTRRLLHRNLLGPIPRSQVSVLGFKEVLWHEVKPEETEDFFGFLESVFPGVRYVLNQRDHEQVMTSGFWQRKDADEVLAALHRVEQIQAHLRATRPDSTYDTRYELITSDDRAESDAQMRGLAEFVIGRCDDDVLAAMRETLRTGHGPNPFGNSRGRRDRRVRARQESAGSE